MNRPGTALCHRLWFLIVMCGLVSACGPESKSERSRDEGVDLGAPRSQPKLKAKPESTPEPKQNATPALKPQAKPASGKGILLSLANMAEPYQRIQASMLASLTRSAEGYELAVKDARHDAGQQNEQILQAALDKPRVALIQSVDPATLETGLARLKENGTIVIGLDARLMDRGCDTVVFCEQRKIGKAAGELVVAALSRKAQDEGKPAISGRVVQLRGADDDAASTARHDGFVSAIQSQPGVILVHDAPARWEKASAIARMREAFRIQKVFDVIYAQNDLMALGASEACLEAKMRQDILIIGTDGLGGTGAGLEMIRRSDIDATVHQPLLVDFAWKLIRKMSEDPAFKPKPSYEIAPIVVTPKNLDDVTREGYPHPAL